MMFSSFWKVIAIVLAGAFATASAFVEFRDKDTNKITRWGKLFFILTVLSVVGGVSAQWLENSAAEERNKKAQTDMLNLLRDTKESIHQLERVLQPIGEPKVTLLLSPECSNSMVRPFCDSIRTEGRNDAARLRIPNGASFKVDKVDWSQWKKGFLMGLVHLSFFKDSKAAQNFAECTDCVDTADLSFGPLVVSGPGIAKDLGKEPVSVDYVAGTEEVTLLVSESSMRPEVRSRNVLSVVDIPGSTLVVWEPNGLLEQVSLTDLYIKTPRGQTVEAHPFLSVGSGAGRKLLYHFADLPSGKR